MSDWDIERRKRRFETTDVRGSFAQAVDAQVLNLSLAGMALQTETQLGVGGQYTFRLGDKNDTVAIKGVVKWCRFSGSKKTGAGIDVVPVYRAGIAFDEVLSHEAEDLLSFMKRNVMVDLRQRLHGRFKAERASVTFESIHEFVVKTMSVSGMLMEADVFLDPEKQFDFELQLGQGKFESRGRVVHVHEGGLAGEIKVHRMGVEFASTSDEQRKILEAFIRDELEKNV